MLNPNVHVVAPKTSTDWLMMPYADEPEEHDGHNVAVSTAMLELCDYDRELLMAIFAERLSYAELADRIGSTKPQVWREVQAALTKLRTTLERSSLGPKPKQRTEQTA